MKTLYIHPVTPDCNKHHVSEKITKRGKTVYQHVAWFDPPGSWYEDEWNIHYDGCDHPCRDLEECKSRLVHFVGPADFVTTPDIFTW